MRELDLPAETSEYLAKLGAPVGEYEFKHRYFWLAFIQGVLLFLLAAPQIVFVVLACFAGHLQTGLGFGAGAAACTFAGVKLMRAAFRHADLTVLEYPVGVIHLQRGRLHAFLWQDIAELGVEFSDSFEKKFKLPYASESYPDWIHKAKSLTLRKADGRELSLNPSWFSNSQKLFESIYGNTFETLWSAAAENFRKGTAVGFGEITLGEAGISLKSKSPTPWQQLAKPEIRITKGELELRLRGTFLDTSVCKQKVGNIPNVHVFIALLNDGLKHFAGQSPS